jgi:hypothetical protein
MFSTVFHIGIISCVSLIEHLLYGTLVGKHKLEHKDSKFAIDE